MQLPHALKASFRDAYKADFDEFPDDETIHELAFTVLDAASFALGVLTCADASGGQPSLDELRNKRDDRSRIS